MHTIALHMTEVSEILPYFGTSLPSIDFSNLKATNNTPADILAVQFYGTFIILPCDRPQDEKQLVLSFYNHAISLTLIMKAFKLK